MTNPHGDFIWYELHSPDPDRSKTFYDAVVGWHVALRGPGDIDYRMIEANGALVGGIMKLDAGMAARGAQPAWLGYIGVDDVDATIARLTEAGGSVVIAAFDMLDVGRIALVADPQGALFYLMHSASDETSHAFAPDQIGHCAWHELRTSDQAAALSLYPALFGWTRDGAMPMGEMGDYSFVAHGGRQIGAVMTAPAAGPPPSWSFYFHVADIAGAPARITDGGGSVAHGPADIPGDSQVVIGIDPHGAIFALVGRKAGAAAA